MRTESLSFYKDAQNLFEIYGYFHERAECLVGKGIVYLKQRKIKLAIKSFKQANELYKHESENIHLEDKLYNLQFLGVALIEDSIYEEAVIILKLAYELYDTKLKNVKLLTEILINWGIALERLNHNKDAFNKYQQAYNLKSYDLKTEKFLESKLMQLNEEKRFW